MSAYATLFTCALLLAAMMRPAADGNPMRTTDDLAAAIEKLCARYPGATVAVALRDDQTGIRLDRNADRLFHAASTMKVPVMIEVYRQAEQGRFSLDDSLEVRNAFRSIVDGSPYRIEDDADDVIYQHLGEKMPVRDLVFQMITVSSNLATNLLIEFVSADSVQAAIERLGTQKMQVLRGVEDGPAYRKGLNNTATAADLALLLDRLRRGQAVFEKADREMIDVLLAQQFNEMIPAGLPKGTRAAHKTGWITAIRHDAAVVFPERGEPYVLVILTEGFSDANEADLLGAEITRMVHKALRS